MKTPSLKAYGITHFQAVILAPVQNAARHRETGKITDAQTPVDGMSFRCYAAMDEGRLPNVRKPRWENFDLLKSLKTTAQKVKLIVKSIKETGLTSQ